MSEIIERRRGLLVAWEVAVAHADFHFYSAGPSVVIKSRAIYTRKKSLSYQIKFAVSQRQKSPAITAWRAKYCVSFLISEVAMYLEDQRFIHEDLERLEQGIADRVAEEPRNVCGALYTNLSSVLA